MKKLFLIVAALAAFGVTGVASAASGVFEAPALIPPGAPAGYLKINAGTCRFVHREIDVRPTATERYARAEDSRDDLLFGCLRNKVNRVGLGAPGPRGPRGPKGATGAQGPAGPAGAPGANGGLSGYVIVHAPINFKQASASVSCPEGDVVLGGGASVETEGSYPSSSTTWTVMRDHRWGNLKTGSVFATCAAQVS